MPPRTLSEQVLTILDGPRVSVGPVSITSLARTFGVSSALMRSCAQQLIADGLVEASMTVQSGVNVIQALTSTSPKAEVAAV